MNICLYRFHECRIIKFSHFECRMPIFPYLFYLLFVYFLGVCVINVEIARNRIHLLLLLLQRGYVISDESSLRCARISTL